MSKDRVNAAIDNAESIQMHVMGVLVVNSTIANFLILLLEKFHESGTVVTAITLCPHANTVIVWLIVRELKEKGLGKVPQRMRGLQGVVDSVAGLAAGDGSNAVSRVGLWNTL